MNTRTLRWAVGSLLVVVGTMMLVVPHQFTSIAFTVIRPHLDIWGTAFLLPGVCLLAAEVLALPRAFEIVAHLAAGIVLVALAYSFTLMANWPPVPNYGFLGLGTALAPFVARAGKHGRADARGDLLPVSSGIGVAVLGAALLALQPEFTSPVFDSFRPHMTWLGILFLVGGLSALYVQLRPAGRTSFILGHLLLGAALVAFCLISAIPLRAWLGIVYYGGVGIVVALTPWLSGMARRVDSSSLRTRLAFTFAVSVGLPPIVVVGIIRRFMGDVLPATNPAWDLSFMLLIAFVVLSALAGVYIAGRVAAPLGALSLVAQRLARGDASAVLPESDLAEVRHLSETIGEMRDDLAASAAERERLLATLDQAGEMAHLGGWEIEVTNHEDINDNPLRWSDEVYRIFGYEPGSVEVSNRLFFEHVHPEDRQRVGDAIARALAQRQEYQVEHRIVRADGTEGEVLEHGEFTFDEAGGLLRINGAVQDVTERKRTEAERERLLAAEQEARALAERAVKARDEFMSIAAHELKTPVTSLQGYSQVIQRDMAKNGTVDPVRLSRSMERIEEQSKRLTKLTEQLLNLSRLEAGKLKLSPEQTDVVALVRDVVATVRHAQSQRVVELRNGRPASAYLDPIRLEQVVTNLVDNALKFSPRESLVEVEVGTDERGWVRIAVRDHGIGVPEEQREQIFERFYQAHAEQHYGGMGIGLFVSKQVVEMHGGTIAVEQPEDGGSRFVVHLPPRCTGPR